MVKLVQMLCPERHCILAVAYEAAGGSFLQACEEIEQIIRDTPMNRWCAICGSRDLRFEEETMKHETLAEAMPDILATERECIETRRVLDAMGKTVDGPADVLRVLRETRKHWR